MTTEIVQFILISATVTFIAALLAIQIAHRLGLIDRPGAAPHKQHKRPTPLAGGITIVLALAVVALLDRGWFSSITSALLMAAAVIFIFGMWDDVRSVPFWVKLIGQTIAVVILISRGIEVHLFGPFLFGIKGLLLGNFLNWFLTWLWIAGLVNAFNLVDSMDGLAVGIAASVLGFLLLMLAGTKQMALIQLTAVTLGICLGLYFFNAPPALLFLGDAGAQLLGLFSAVIAILFTPQAPSKASSWFAPILMLGVPIFDTSLVVISRMRRGQPFYSAGRDHTYHRLLALGFDSNRAVLLMHAASLFLGGMAYIALSLQPFYANLIFGLALLAGAVILFFLDSKKRWP